MEKNTELINQLLFQEIIWFTNMSGCFGLLKANNKKGTTKYFIHKVPGKNAECDINYIALNGSEVKIDNLIKFFMSESFGIVEGRKEDCQDFKCNCEAIQTTFLTIETKEYKYRWCSYCGNLHAEYIGNGETEEKHRVMEPAKKTF